MSDETASITECRQPLIHDDNKDQVGVISNPESPAERFRQVNLDANPNILRSYQCGSELINFDEVAEVASDGHQSFTFPAFNREVMELDPYCSCVELRK